MKVIAQDTSWYMHSTFIVPFVTLLVFLTLIVGSVTWWSIAYANRIADGISIDSINIGGLTQDQAINILYDHYSAPLFSVTLSNEGEHISSTSAQLGLFKAYEPAVKQAYAVGRSQSILTNFSQLFSLWSKEKNIEVHNQFQQQKIVEMVKEFARKINSDGVLPTASLSSKKQVTIHQGQLGYTLDIPRTIEDIQQANKTQDLTISATVTTTGKVLSSEELSQAQHRAEEYVNKTVTFSREYQKVSLEGQEIISLLAFPEGFNDQNIDTEIKQVSQQFTIEPSNAVFDFNPKTLKVLQFVPEVIGTKVKQEELTQTFLHILRQIPSTQESEFTIDVPVTEFYPKVALKDLNDLGINERIGFGESYYDHSIPSRIHNVSTANKIVNNTIVSPGEEFSFNKALGEVSQQTGFQQAYVIRSGATVLGDGGGVCQVSTTLFRALLNAGLNITKRKAHSYRVSYYELDNDPGFDATVYSGDVDLRFKNDTGHYVLLTFQDDPQTKYMTVHIYGTSDGRTSEISNYQKWGYQAPPAPQYIDDPTLPAGKLIQVDWSVAGIKAKFTNTVRDKNGKVMYENEYYSNYIPWNAKYRRGTGV